ncbi:MAG: hypothetical protein QOJ11_1436 [Frankiales bacterium]|jgi:predicted ABC-type ATPase|nr:hypothetical protein [Frankiales bacterium]
MPLLWLCGPSGVGKSSVGWEVFAQLSRRGVTTAFLDSDQISLCSPTPEGGTHRVRARSLAAIWPNLRAAGAQCVVMSGWVDTSEEVHEYTSLLADAAFTVCRLRVGRAELEARFVGRQWRLDLAEETLLKAEALDRRDFADLVIDTDGLDVAHVAQLVCESVPWPGSVSPARRGLPVVPPAPAAGRERLPVLWFSGPPGVGKSTVGWLAYTEAQRAGVPAAYIDVKDVGALRPATGDDPGGHHLKASNVAVLWARFRQAGAGCLVVSGDADHDDTVRGYARLLPASSLTVCRLVAEATTLAERIQRRRQGGGPRLPGDELLGLDAAALRHAAEESARVAQSLERAGAGDLRVVTDGLSPQEVVREVQTLVTAWPGRPAR